MKTKIIKVKDYNSTKSPYEVMLYQQSDGTYCVQVKDFDPDCWKSKQNATDYFNWFKKNKINLLTCEICGKDHPKSTMFNDKSCIECVENIPF